jgi:hypothetical protein
MTKRLAVLVFAALAVYGGVKWRGHHAAAADEATPALDRLWIDHLPANPRDEISVFLALSDEPLGIFQTASQWRGKYEMFQHETSGEDVRIVYPATGERETVRIRARKCDDNGWEYCLEMKGASRGVKKYYSMEGWEVGSTDAAAPLLRHVFATGK